MQLLIISLLVWLVETGPIFNTTLVQEFNFPLQLTEKIIKIENSSISYSKIYALVAKGGGSFRLAGYDPTTMAEIDSSPPFAALFDLSTQQINPTLYNLNNLFLVIYRYSTLNGTTTAATIRFNPLNLQNYTKTAQEEYYIGIYFASFDLFYYKTATGKEKYYPNASSYQNGVSVLLYTSNATSNSISCFKIYRKDAYSIITVDSSNGKIRVIGFSSNNEHISTSLQNYTVAGLQSFCVYYDYIYIHTLFGEIKEYYLQNFSLVRTVTNAFTESLECFYDSLTYSVVLLNLDESGASVGQVYLGIYSSSGSGSSGSGSSGSGSSGSGSSGSGSGSSAPTYASSYQNLIDLGNASLIQKYKNGFYLIEESQVELFNLTSCNNQLQYIPSTFACIPCASTCKRCNGAYNCSSCQINYALKDEFCCRSIDFVQIVNTTEGITKTCVSCYQIGCLNCTNITFCLSCRTGYILINATCFFNSSTNGSSTQSNGSTQNATFFDFDNDDDNDEDDLGRNVSILFTNSILLTLIQNDFINFLNKIPSRKTFLKTVLSFFVCFDDLYLYQFHERNYGNIMNALFDSIEDLESEKWNSFDSVVIDHTLSWFGTSQQAILKRIDENYKYSSERFIKIKGNGQGLIVNSWSFLSKNVLLSLFIFATCRIIFKIIFKHKFSLPFRPYSFFTFLPYYLLEGNVQILIFFLISDVTLSFQFSTVSKILVFNSYFVLFCVLVFSIGGYIYLYGKFGKLIKYFTDNTQFSHKMGYFLIIQFGIKNLLLGIFHNICRSASLYTIQLSLLGSVQLICFANYLFFLRIFHFKRKMKAWIMFLLCFLRILIILTLILQQSYLSSLQLLQLCENILLTLVETYIVLLYLGIGFALVQLLCESTTFCLIKLIRFIREEIKKRLSRSHKKCGSIIIHVYPPSEAIQKEKERLSLDEDIQMVQVSTQTERYYVKLVKMDLLTVRRRHRLPRIHQPH